MVNEKAFTLEELQRRAGIVNETSLRNNSAHLMNSLPVIVRELDIINGYLSNQKPSLEHIEISREKLNSVISYLKKFQE